MRGWSVAPRAPGNVAAMYLNGLPTSPVPCATNRFASPGAAPGYLEFAMLHEILHTLGYVPTCAPNHTRAGHVSDSPQDLMYAGELAWQPSALDVGPTTTSGTAWRVASISTGAPSS